MSVPRALILAVSILSVTAGCAAHRNAVPTSATSAAPSTAPAKVSVSIFPASRPALDRKSMLALDEVPDRPTLPTTTPSTTQPPLDALELYAKARIALANNQWFTAASVLERAVKLDPYSAELHRALSRACVASGNRSRAIDAMKRAAELDPDDLRTRTALSRLYLAQSDPTTALSELRLAIQTSGYKKDEAGAAIADYFLARALQQQGYDRAALEEYQSLIKRLDRPTLAVRSDPELNDWASHPQAVYADLGRLCEKLGEWQQALDAWRVVAEHDPDDFDTSRHVIDNLIALGNGPDALSEAAELVRRSGASARSLEMLRDVCRRLGNEQAAFDEMRRLQKQRPNDRALLFALADLLGGSGRDREAEELLSGAVRSNWDPEVVRKLFRFYADKHRAPEAARLLIEAAAARPGDVSEVTDRFEELIGQSRRDALRAGAIAKLDVPPDAEGAKCYFVALAAFSGGREVLGREMLDRAVAARPLFSPALRLATERLVVRSDLDEPARAEAANQYVALAEKSGPPGLADELRAVRLIAQGQRAEAITLLERAIKASTSDSSGDAKKVPSADLLLRYAALQNETGNRAKFEQTMWRIISDHPTSEAAYVALMNYQLDQDRGIGPAVMTVLQRWLANDPSSVTARLWEARVLNRARQTQEALRVAGELVRQQPNNALVLFRAYQVYRSAQRESAFVQMVEEIRSRDPANLSAADVLVTVYTDQQQPDQAVRVVDAARAAVSNEPKLLYFVAYLYNRVDRKEASQQTLLDVLKLTPQDPGANNDLGYVWAEDGINLDRAENMVRIAVQAEPDNSSFLDSLGWVLYKRGKFDEARQQFEQAVGPSDAPFASLSADPVVLDHLGDTLYRLHNSDRAVSLWQKAQERVAATGDDGRPDVVKLRDSLRVKLEQAKQGKPVDVAPTANQKEGGGSGSVAPARAER